MTLPHPRPHDSTDVTGGVIPAPAGAPADPVIVVEHLTRSFRHVTALNDLSFTLPAGRITALLGSNGSGKTTVLKILAGVLSDYSGTVQIAGHTPGPQTKALVAFLPDADFLARNLTVESAIAQFSRLFPDFDAQRAHDLTDFFSLPHGRALSAMSKGMKEKLRIALIMGRRARIYLLDEPISGVDPAAREVILEGILHDCDPQALMLLSTHLISDVEHLIDSAIFIRDGRLLLAGDADDLRQHYGMSLDHLFRQEYR